MPGYADPCQCPNPPEQDAAGAETLLEAGAEAGPGWEPAQPRGPAPESPRGVKEAGRQVTCAVFYLRCYCLYGGRGQGAC